MGRKKRVSEKRCFLSAILPWEGDTKGTMLRKIFIWIFLGVFLFSGWKLLDESVLKPGVVSADNDELASIYYNNRNTGHLQKEDTLSGEEDPAVSQAQVPDKESSSQNERVLSIKKLQEINEDILGWITVPNTVIDLSVLQSDSNNPEYYLYRNYKREYSFAGSAFLDARNELEDRALIIYGHSLNSGLMFTDLLKYKNLDFYKQAPMFTFDTIEGAGQWKIFSVFLANTLPSQGEPFNYLRTSFSGDSDFMNYVYQLRIRSLLDLPVDISPKDPIVLLSTCSYEYDGYRLVVAARKVRDGESPTVNVELASNNSKTVYPDNYRIDRGLGRPDWADTYEEALDRGQINWVVKE